MISYFRSGPGEWWRFRSDTRYATHTSDYGPEKMIFLVDARGRRQVPTPYPPPPTKTYFIYYDCDHRLCTDVCLPPFFLPRLPTSASLPSPPPTLPVPLERGHLLSSLRFLLCGCVYASWSTRWFRNNDPSFRGWVRSTLKSRWLVFFFFFYILSMIRAVEFWKISKKRRGSRGSKGIFLRLLLLHDWSNGRTRIVELWSKYKWKIIWCKCFWIVLYVPLLASARIIPSWRIYSAGLRRRGADQHPPPPPLRTYAEFKVRGEFFERWCLASLSRFIDLPDISMLGPWSNPCRCES